MISYMQNGDVFNVLMKTVIDEKNLYYFILESKCKVTLEVIFIIQKRLI